MTRFHTLILILYLLFSVENVYGQNIAYANIDSVIKNSNVGKKIISYFSNKNNELIKDFKNKEKIFKEKEQSLKSKKNILDNNEYIKKVDEIKKEINSFNIEHKKKINQIKTENDEVLKALMNEINKILKEFAETNNIDIIFSSNQMLIGKSKLDVSNELLNIVNKQITNFKIK